MRKVILNGVIIYLILNFLKAYYHTCNVSYVQEHQLFVRFEGRGVLCKVLDFKLVVPNVFIFLLLTPLAFINFICLIWVELGHLGPIQWGLYRPIENLAVIRLSSERFVDGWAWTIVFQVVAWYLDLLADSVYFLICMIWLFILFRFVHS